MKIQVIVRAAGTGTLIGLGAGYALAKFSNWLVKSVEPQVHYLAFKRCVR